MHFTPTPSSWLNLVERFFRDLNDHITAGSFALVKELADTIIAFLAERHQNPKRYVWKAEGEEILRKIQRARETYTSAPDFTGLPRAGRRYTRC